MCERSELSAVRAGRAGTQSPDTDGTPASAPVLKACPGGSMSPVRDQIPPQSAIGRRTSIIAMRLAENQVVGGLTLASGDTLPESLVRAAIDHLWHSAARRGRKPNCAPAD
jgi:hypothetical protein